MQVGGSAVGKVPERRNEARQLYAMIYEANVQLEGRSRVTGRVNNSSFIDRVTVALIFDGDREWRGLGFQGSTTRGHSKLFLFMSS